jgi:hypothetical protein
VDEPEVNDSVSDGKWWSVRLIFRVLGAEDYAYEERVTLWHAETMSDAIETAEAEGREYSVAGDEQLFEYTGLAQAFHTYIPDRGPRSGDEVFSLIRDSHLEPDDYTNRFFDTGDEHSYDLKERPTDSTKH